MGLSDAQFKAAIRTVNRATSKQSISVLHEGENVVVNVTRPGFDGYQAIETTITQSGGKQVVQKAFDQFGNLVHYDPKTP
jgi:hypothetical protein